MEFFGQVCIGAKPIERDEACEEGNTEVLAVFLKGKVLGLVGVVKDDTSETQDCIQTLWLGDDG